MPSNLDLSRLATAAAGMMPDIEAEISFDLDAAILTKNLKQIYDLAPRLALLPKLELDVAYAKVTQQFGKEARISDLKAHVKLEQAKLKSADAGSGHTTSCGDWKSQLLLSEKGKILPCLENITLFLENSPEWDGVLGYNEFTAGYTILLPAPAPVSAKPGAEIEDQFDTEVTRWIEQRGLMVKPESVRRVIDAFARHSPFHPVREFLESLPAWDGVPRVGSWLIDYCGVESSDENPNFYAMAVGQKFLISAVARIMQPGCKADHMLILEGPQGIGKSTVVRTLAGPEWFSDQLSDMGSKDASMQLRGKWILELGELSALRRAEIERIKSFITQQAETFRPPYGRRVITFPRQCVFMGTTNADTYLKDETGNRRFWPVKCTGALNVDDLKRDREQIWAEAVYLYRDGTSWWPDEEKFITDASEEQKQRVSADSWESAIEAWLEEPTALRDQHGPVAELKSTKDFVLCDDVLIHCVRKPLDKWSQEEKNRVGRCMRALGWKYGQKAGSKTDRPWGYVKSIGALESAINE